MFYLAIIVYVILSSFSAFLVRKIDKHYEKSSTKHYETVPIEIINYTSGRNIEKGKYNITKHFTSVIIVVICLLTLRYLFNIEFVWQIAIGLALGLTTPLFASLIIAFFDIKYLEKHPELESMSEKIQYSYIHKINVFRNLIVYLIISLFVVSLFLPSFFILGFILAQLIFLLRTHGLKMEYLQKEKKI